MKKRLSKLFTACLFIMMVLAGGTSTVACDNESNPTSPMQDCCRVCTQGKACGDTCINASYNCNTGPGCACNG